ncbi:MAG: hypothetical protein HFJ59_03050 [Clostridia bacterium]|nr:hypothetical protein [Clostridia bacterium]
MGINTMKVEEYGLFKTLNKNEDGYNVTILLKGEEKTFKQKYQNIQKDKVQQMQQQLKQCVEYNSKVKEIARYLSVSDIVYGVIDGIAYS